MAEELKFTASAVGFDKVEAGLKGVNSELKKTGTATSKASSAFSEVGSSISSLINPTTIAIAAVTAIGKALFDYVTETTAAEKAQRELNETLAQSEAHVAGNLVRLQALVTIAGDITKSDNERKEALGALNKEYDHFNGKLTLANINTQEAIDLINQQTSALVRQAKIKGLENLISKTAAKNAEILTSEIGDQLTLLDKIKIAGNTFFSKGLSSGDFFTVGLQRREEKLKEGEEAIKKYSEVLNQLLGEDALNGTLFKEKVIKPKTIKVKPQKFEFDRLPDIGSIWEKTNPKLTLNIPDATLVLTKDHIGIDPDWERKTMEALQLFLKRIRIEKLADEFSTLVAGTFSNIAVDALTAAGEAVAAIATSNGGAVPNIFEGLMNSLGTQVQELGKFLIKSAITIKIAKEAFTKLLSNPIAAAAVGVGLVALGALLKKAASRQFKGFALGGQTPGGTILVGERGPELISAPRGSVVTPAGQTSNILSGVTGGNWTVQTVIAGADLRLILQRANSVYNQTT